jgi:predicted hotdog family 3-hydroxylacyl-ACP dehydratase
MIFGSNNMIVTQDNILTIIPQRPPFVMIDELLACDELRTNTRFTIEKDNVLVENGELTEAGLMENIAQTAAAGAGYEAQSQQKPVAIGYIGAVKNLEIFALPLIGNTIVTEVVVENKIFDVTLISGTIKCDGKTLARCEMKIFIKS